MIIALYIASVAADVVSTIYARSRGGAEGNPILRKAGKFWLPVRLAMAAGIAIIWHFTGAPDWVLIVGAAFYVVVAVSNEMVARRAG